MNSSARLTGVFGLSLCGALSGCGGSEDTAAPTSLAVPQGSTVTVAPPPANEVSVTQNNIFSGTSGSGSDESLDYLFVAPAVDGVSYYYHMMFKVGAGLNAAEAITLRYGSYFNLTGTYNGIASSIYQLDTRLTNLSEDSRAADGSILFFEHLQTGVDDYSFDIANGASQVRLDDRPITEVLYGDAGYVANMDFASINDVYVATAIVGNSGYVDLSLTYTDGIINGSDSMGCLYSSSLDEEFSVLDGAVLYSQITVSNCAFSGEYDGFISFFGNDGAFGMNVLFANNERAVMIEGFNF